MMTTSLSAVKRNGPRGFHALYPTTIGAFGLLALIACAPSEDEPPVTREASPSEAADEPMTAPQRWAPGVISTDAFELGASFSPDGRTVYLARIGDGFETSVILVSQRQGETWSDPAPVSFAGPYRDIDPFVSIDGRQLFFQSDRPIDGSEAKDWDLWVSDWTGDGWGEPRNLGAPVNTPGIETYPVVTADGTLYFSSDRPGGEGEGDVYRARLVDGAYGEPENLGPPINTAEFDSNVFVAPDESYLILSSSNLPGHVGSGDLYVSRRADDGGWTPPEPVPLVNTPDREFAPVVSPDGEYLYFTRDQRDPELGPVYLGDLYRVELRALGLASER